MVDKQNQFLRTILKYKSCAELNAELVQNLIEKIYVYRGKRVEIIWKWNDEFAKVMGGTDDENRLKIAMYLRLSKEDDWNAQESNSISYQRLLLRGYIERNFENYEILEFVDDGYSGTSMDRPAMQELLAAARQKK